MSKYDHFDKHLAEAAKPEESDGRSVSTTMLVATELTTEDFFDIFVALAQKLTHERDRAIKDATSWKREFEMYRSAWIREMGGKTIQKSHDIDGCVLMAKKIYQNSQNWIAYQNSLSGRDPFWNVPEPIGERGAANGE